ncbi:ISL3 family transposase [Kitasatospora sp. NPDC089797]|uniref:ISL3 family transposase n=1 Tax=Kitasatospora sp. NPDC089797 TaxID=3155298 RepID=UPI003443F034
MALRSIEDVLFPGVDVELEWLTAGPEVVLVEVAACGPPAGCPGCGSPARRRHSSYWRTLAERPLAGRKLAIRLRVRRFFCDRARCRRTTFVEQVTGLSERHVRSSVGLKEWLRAVATELGGRAGERLCHKLSIAAGRTRLLGLLEAPEAPERAPRVLGVDEFAFRRGRTYGTILIDVETGRVVDVLPDRTSETFAAWLHKHPGAEIICRDRATVYTRAIKEAAPDAIEVADRWHLLQNLSAAVEKTCHQHRSCLRKHVEQEEPPPEPPMINLPVPELPRTPVVERTRDRHADVHQLREQKWTISAIARHLDLDGKTVRRFKTTLLDELLVAAKDFGIHNAKLLEPFKPYMDSRFTADCTSGTRLFHEIRVHGYTGSIQVARRHLAKLREGTAEPVRADIPNPRRITSWIMRPLETLTDQEEKLLNVRIACPDIDRAFALARCFRDLLASRRGGMLPDWIRQCEQEAPAPVRLFAGFLRQNLAAVTARLTLEWSSGKVEGNLNRIILWNQRCQAVCLCITPR